MKGLCHYKNSKPVEFIGLSYWLKERETYDQIKSLEFFTKFRRWKTLKMWRKSCKSYKRNEARKDLEEKLFISYEDLRTALFKHRELCYDMSQYKFIDLNLQMDNNQEVMTLQNFATFQDATRKRVQEKIKDCSCNCRKIVKKGFKSS